MTNDYTRRTDKYNNLSDASYEALMKERNVYPYLMPWELNADGSYNPKWNEDEPTNSGFGSYEGYSDYDTWK